MLVWAVVWIQRDKSLWHQIYPMFLILNIKSVTMNKLSVEWIPDRKLWTMTQCKKASEWRRGNLRQRPPTSWGDGESLASCPSLARREPWTTPINKNMIERKVLITLGNRFLITLVLVWFSRLWENVLTLWEYLFYKASLTNPT